MRSTSTATSSTGLENIASTPETIFDGVSNLWSLDSDQSYGDLTSTFQIGTIAHFTGGVDISDVITDVWYNTWCGGIYVTRIIVASFIMGATHAQKVYIRSIPNTKSY